MAGQRRGTDEAPEETPGTDAPLAHSDMRDAEDTTVTGPPPNLSGTRLRALPQHGGTRVIIKSQFFNEQGVDQGAVTFDFFKDKFTVAVGTGKPLSEAGANALLKVFPNRFKFVDGK